MKKNCSAASHSKYSASYSVKGKAMPLQAWTDPEGFQEVEVTRFQDNWHMKVVLGCQP